MRKSTVFLTMVLVASLLSAGMVQPEPADAYQTAVHPLIASYARMLYSTPEINAHASAIDSGAYHEDELDVVWDEYGIGGACVTITHFWDADRGPDDLVDSVFCDGYNAWQKARILWGMAVGEYLSGDLGSAYHYLGHVSHLLMDMAVPTHAHEDMHPTSDMYEDWLGVTEATLTSSELNSLLALGPVEPPAPVHQLYWLFATTNQRADFYASEDYDGDAYDPDGWVDFNTLEYLPKCQDQDDFDAECLGVVLRNSHMYAIRAVAALFRLFEQTTNQDALTVVIDEVNELECHDDAGAFCESDPDFFVRINIDGFWFRNEGLQTEDDHIYPGWAFARPVGLTGSVGVVIQLIDEDEDPNPDDKSDIDPGGGRDLDLTIDLAKCIALEPGAITGDVSGSCGTTLTSWGNDSDRSQIWFRIIPPNAPPVADAGPDMTVNEADVVTLTGSFTDPNVEDTHTVLWHLESSTNGQTVPDTTAPSLTFTAIDDGTYTFSFTVTDNHGASDTDEVVVTALNVAPVPIIEHITDETGAEIGVDVPVALVGLEIDLEGTFTDVGTLDTHTATLNWGDGYLQTTFDWFVDSTGGIEGYVAADHIYVTAGSYSIGLEITDDDGGTGHAAVLIEVVDASGAVEAVAELLAPLAGNPDIQMAIDKLIGNNDGLDFNGALDLLEKGNTNAALEMIKQALGYLEAAEATDPGLDLTYEKSLLALAAKSVALGAIAEAQTLADGQKDFDKIAAAQSLVASGDGHLAILDYVAAVGEYQRAVRTV